MALLIPAFHILFLLAGVWIYVNKYCPEGKQKIFISSFLFKVLCGLTISFLYISYFEGSDSLTYYQEAARMDDYRQENQTNFWSIIMRQDHPVIEGSVFYHQPRALLFSKVVYFIYHFTGGNFWLIAVYLTIFSFSGFWMFFMVATKFNILPDLPLIVALFIWPSVVFWSSGLIKESISVGLIMMIAALTVSFNYHKPAIWKVLVFGILAYGLFKLKYYYAGIVIPLAICYSMVNYAKMRIKILFNNPFYQIVLLIFTFIILVLAASNLHHNLQIKYLPEVIVNNYQLFIEKSGPGKAVIFENIQPTFTSFITKLPAALFAGLFRPSVLDVTNIWSLLASIENAILLFLGLIQLKNIKKLNQVDVPLKVSVILTCLIMAAFLSFSAPNFGTLVRYKAGFLPFLVLIIMADNPLLHWIKKNRRTAPV